MLTERKKLIEVALPLDDINRESAREKSIRHGHPSTLHLWWARRPLAACRAVLFASIVDDPSSRPDLFPTEADQERERERLFDIIRKLVKWKNSTNEDVLRAARAEILKATNGTPPPVLDPFCGGGSIPLEAQRLGLEAHGSDLNPVAVLITKALIEIPPKFAGLPPVSLHARDAASASRQATRKQDLLGTTFADADQWRGARGLAEDIRFYGAWMREEAEKRIGHLYPAVEVTPEMAQERPDLKPLVGQKLTVIAWLWARTVRCPNPACGVDMPLVASFWLSKKKTKETWVEPVIESDSNTIEFEVRSGVGEAPQETVTRKGARCIACNTAVPFNYVRSEGQAGRISARLMAVVAEGARGRVYLAPSPEHDEAFHKANQANPTWTPSMPLPQNPRDFKTPNYGLTTFADLFTPRQLVALTTFSDLVSEARGRVLHDAVAAGLSDDGIPLNDGGTGATAYADAVATYLAFAVDRLADRSSTICSWDSGYVKVRNTFGRQAIPMTWDFAEANPLSGSTGNFLDATAWVAEVIETCPARREGVAKQADATTRIFAIPDVLVSTDPPYYDNIGYADLSDFFYIWLRRSLGHLYPDIFRTLLVPKSNELIASPYRHDGDRRRAETFFEEGLLRAFQAMRQAQHPDFPLTVYYAFKQAEEDDSAPDGALASTGWETMLEGLLRAGFSITGTWPMRTELGNRMIGRGTNALASSIVVVCRPRPADAPVATRRQFLAALRAELPDALIRLQHGNIAPVDLAQAAIGPGMAIFSRYASVLEADGSPMSVRTALELINQELDAYLEAQESELDPETRFCVAWYEQYGFSAGPYGEADVLARAKNTAVGALERAGIAESQAGKVRLLRRDELQADWDPERDQHKPVWECTQQVIRRFETEGAAGAGALLGKLGADLSEQVRALAYRLYTLCERRGRAEEALAYNGLVVGWHDIQQQIPADVTERQARFDM